MGKRSEFPRRPQDKYFTPYEAVVPLLPFLEPQTQFVEPCAGDGRLIRHLERHGHGCVDAFDIEPGHGDIPQEDALTVPFEPMPGDVCITNPPWRRDVLHPLIEKWRLLMPTWFLLDANWMFTKQAAPYLRYTSDVVVIGRVKWIEGSKMAGKDDAAWFRFQAEPCQTVFHNNRA